jgi:5-formyltetrahydrofolate cyclo-ligase
MWRVNNEEKKSALRKAVSTRRDAITRQERFLWSRAIQARALGLPAYRVSYAVALYSALPNEVGTERILDDALTAGRKVFYPRTSVAGIPDFIRVTTSEELRAGPYGVREPAGLERLSEADRSGLLVFVPGVAFDAAGNRLGRGKGWYDRMLAWLDDKAVLVALAYECQVVEEVPTETWDRRVHYIVTENRIIGCGAVGPALTPHLQ